MTKDNKEKMKEISQALDRLLDNYNKAQFNIKNDMLYVANICPYPTIPDVSLIDKALCKLEELLEILLEYATTVSNDGLGYIYKLAEYADPPTSIKGLTDEDRYNIYQKIKQHAIEIKEKRGK